MSTDKYLDREYHYSRYNCSHFVNEVWMDLTGECIIGICQSFIQGSDGDFTKRIRERIRLEKPETPCVAIMQTDQKIMHAGVFIDGDILHLTESGVQRDSIDRLRVFSKLSFYK